MGAAIPPSGELGARFVPSVIEKIFPVYRFTALVAQAVGPHAALGFTVDPATPFAHVDCAVRNLRCDRTGTAPACACTAASVCPCDGDSVDGFSVPFVTSGAYELTMRVIDPFGRPGRGDRAFFSIDLPAVTVTPSAVAFGTTGGVFCFRAATVDRRPLSYR